MENFKKYDYLTTKRDKMVFEHFGNDYLNLINYPEERYWYIKYISEIDKEIVDVANKIMKEDLKTNVYFRDLFDVYSNKQLNQYYYQTKNKIENEELQK